MPDALAGITYVHSLKYYSKGIDEQGPFYDVEYYIDDYADADAFVNALRGVNTVDGPHRYPLSPNLICRSAVAEGVGRRVKSADGRPDYEGGARIRAQYRSPASVGQGQGGTNLLYDDPFRQHQIDPDTPIVWCTQQLGHQVQSLQLRDHGYQWSDGTKASIPFQRDVHITVMKLTFHRRQYLPMSLVFSLSGCINSVPFLGAETGTVLFEGSDTRRTWSTGGQFEQEVVLTFKRRAEHWNKFFREDRMTWDEIKDADGRRRYVLADLRPLVTI